MLREVKVDQIYRHFKGHTYIILAIAKDSDDLSKKIVYKNIDNGEVWVRGYDEFISKVDKNKYPNSEYEYRFELVK